MSSKVGIVKQYLAKQDAGDIDGVEALVTDDFLFKPNSDHKTTEIYPGSEAGINIDQLRDLRKRLGQHITSFETTLDSAKEDGNAVHATGVTHLNYHVPEVDGKPASDGESDVYFTAVYKFTGNKISYVETSVDKSKQP